MSCLWRASILARNEGNSKLSSTDWVKPKIGNYQLLGDSIFVRFASKILDQSYLIKDGTPTLGYCASGQRIKQLTQKIKNSEYILLPNVIILIGTNDVLCGKSLTVMVRHYRNLLQLLRLKKVKKIVILTLPPVPRLALMPSHWEKVQAFNQFLLGLDSKDDCIHVIDILPSFIKQDSILISAPAVIRNKTFPHDSLVRTPKGAIKRKSENYNGIIESPKMKVLPPLEDPEEFEKMSPFCRYLNKVNQAEHERELISSSEEEREEWSSKVRPFIDFKFWERLKRTITYDPKESLPYDCTFPSATSPKILNDSFNLVGSPTLSPNSNASPSSTSSSPSRGLSNLHQSIIKFTNAFLRLDFYEIFFANGKRVDMIHPNLEGLKLIQSHLNKVI